MADVDEVVAFLLEALDEYERVAIAASPSPWEYQDVDSVGGGRLCDATVAIAELNYDSPSVRIDPRIRRTLTADEADRNGAHIALWDPARVLAEIEAKRRILDAILDDTQGGPWNGCGDDGEWKAWEWVVRQMAQPLSDRPGFKDEWRLT